VTWENVDSSLWSLCELCSGTTCSCLPCLRPLASRYFPAMFTRYGRGYSGQLNSHAEHSEPPADTEIGPLSSPSGSPTESDSYAIYGLEDYKSHPLPGAGRPYIAPRIQTTDHHALGSASEVNNLEVPSPIHSRPEKEGCASQWPGHQAWQAMF
jgi:hypothetical protein